MSNMNINNKGWNCQWLQWEDEIVKKYYPKNGYEKVLEFLPHRNKKGIQIRAHKLKISYLTYNEDYFDLINSSDKAYWLGFLYTDGYITSQNRWGLELSIIDIEHIKKILKNMCCNINIKFKTRKSPSSDNLIESCGFQIKNSKMYNDLLKCGITKNKTYLLQFPEENILPKKYYKDFIRGLFDGDGSYTFYKYNRKRKDKMYDCIYKEISFVCKSESFIQKLKDIIFEECGVEFNLNYNKRDNNLPTLRTSKKDHMEYFFNYIYQDIDNIILLKRKYEKSQEILNYCRV